MQQTILRWTLAALLLFLVTMFNMLKAQSSVILESEWLQKGDTCLFFKYIDGRPTPKDTLVLATAGRLEITAKKALPQGLYTLETPHNIHKGTIDILIEKNRQTILVISHDVKFNTIQFKGSPESGVYEAYISTCRYNEIQLHNLIEQANTVNNSYESEKLKASIQILQKQLYDLGNDIVKEYPHTLLSAIVSCNNPPLAPGSILDNYMQDTISTIYKNTTQFIRENYWKNVNFSDTILLTTPFLYAKTQKYVTLFNSYDAQLLAIIDDLMKKATANPRMFQAIADALYIYYNHPPYNDNSDDIAINILKQVKAQAFVPRWKKQSIEHQIAVHEKNKVGTQAANFLLKDSIGGLHQLNALKTKYTILYFYDPDCSRCSQTTPIVKGWFFKGAPKDATVLAIYVEQDENVWQKYLKENTYPPRWVNVWDKNGADNIRSKYWIESLPAIYLLDENKKVLLKNANYKQLINYFQNLSR